jgi:hypothetical protein
VRLFRRRQSPASTVPEEIVAKAWPTPRDEGELTNWVVYSQADPRRNSIVADCSREHVASVASSLWLSDQFPDDVLIQAVASPVTLDPVGPPVDLRADFQARYRRVREVGQ